LRSLEGDRKRKKDREERKGQGVYNNRKVTYCGADKQA
jgi:hypothetical protein